MSNFNFEIKNPFPGTDKQKNVGIMGTFTLDISVDDGVLVSLSDLMLKKTKDGSRYYIESPSREYTNKQGESKRANYVRVWPEKQNWDKQNAIVEMAKAELESASRSAPSRPSNQSSPASSPSSSGADMPW